MKKFLIALGVVLGAGFGCGKHPDDGDGNVRRNSMIEMDQEDAKP